MADHNPAAEEVLLDVRVAEASGAYKFYLNNEKKILGTTAVVVFLTVWELIGNTLQLINPDVHERALRSSGKPPCNCSRQERSGTISASAALSSPGDISFR